MFLATNLQQLRKTHNNLSQEALADHMDVSRQTISKWESGTAMPEVEKLLALSEYFHCTLDQLLREDMAYKSDAYSAPKVVSMPRFRMAQYTVLSPEPEEDSISHMNSWAKANGLGDTPTLIGCDMPILSIEQQSVHGLRGYLSAVILPDSFTKRCEGVREMWQEAGVYAVITIRNPFVAPFDTIPKAYKVLQRYIEQRGIRYPHVANQLCCFEHVYQAEGTTMMDVYIAVDPLTKCEETVTL